MKARNMERERAHNRRRREERQDKSVPISGTRRIHRTALGLAMLHAVALPGVCYDIDEIAAWTGTSPEAVRQIEEKALRKLRRRATVANDPMLRELLEQFTRRL